MRFPIYLCALAVTCFAVWPNIATAQEPPAFPNRWGNAVVTTYVSPAGRQLKAPDPKNPTSYLGLSRGCTLGSNPGDRLPDVDEMTKFVVDTLASQGYVGSAPGTNEPELFIVLEWGRLQPQTADLLSFLGYDARKDIGSSPNPGMLGPEVFRRNMRTPAVETVLSYSQGPIYGILLTAYDYQTVLAKEAGDASAEAEEPVLFWQTRIALRARGKSMADALPAMVFAASQLIGRESDGPALRDRDHYWKSSVEMRDIEIMEYTDED